MSIGDSKMPAAKKAAMKRMRGGGIAKKMRGGGGVSPRKAMGMMRGGKVKK